MTPERRQLIGEMSNGPGRSPMRIEGRTACACGCGLPDRVDFEFGGVRISLTDPDVVDAAIDVIQEARLKLWGPKP